MIQRELTAVVAQGCKCSNDANCDVSDHGLFVHIVFKRLPIYEYLKAAIKSTSSTTGENTIARIKKSADIKNSI